MSARKEFEALFRLQAELGPGYQAAFAKAQAEVKEMQEGIVALDKTQRDISSYQKQQNAIKSTQEKLKILQEEYRNLQREQAQTESFSASLENAMLRKQQQIERTADSLERHKEKAKALGKALENAKIDTDHLADESARLTREMEELKRAQQGVVEEAAEMGGSGAEAIQAFQESLIAEAMIESLQKIYNGLKACTDASIEFESAVTGVYKTVDGTDEQLAAISDEVKELSTVIPATTEDISGVAEAAGQLGIATENVMDFTEVMINLGESTNLTAEQAAEDLAKFANITGTAAGNYGRLGSVIVDLGNNFATTERDIVSMATRLASAGTIAGLSEAQILALAAAMSSVGIEAEAGGTAMTQTLGAIETAVAAGDESLDEFARISGMTAEQFAATWEGAPVEALTAFIGGLGRLDQQGENATLVLDGLGLSGVRQSNMLKALSLAADTLTGTVETANRAWIENNALTEEAAKRYATTASQQQMAANAANNLKIAVGDALTPALRTLYGVEIDVLGGLTDFVEEHPALVQSVTVATGVIGAATVGITGYAAAVKLWESASSLLLKNVPYLTTIMGGAAAAAVTLGAVTWALTTEFDKEAAAVRELTEESRREYALLQEKEAEYQQACRIFGETAEETRYLAWELEELNAAFEDGKQTLEEYLAECDSVNTSAREMLDVNRDNYEAVDDNIGKTMALTSRLRELEEQNDNTVASQEEMKAIVAELNSMFPDLAVSYDSVTGRVEDYVAAIEAGVKAQYEAQKYQSAQKGMLDAYTAQQNAQKQLHGLNLQQAAARERLNKAEAAYAALQKQLGPDAGMALAVSQENKELQAAQEAWYGYTQQINETQSVLDQATAEYNEYKQQITDYAEETVSAGDATAQVRAEISNTWAEVQTLATAYQDAYNAAYESISGQYALWDQAETVTATGVGTMRSAIDSQITYWQDYNANLEVLTGKAKDIEGLSEMIASFADGSADSVNAFAGLAAASDEDLAAMVADWQTLQAEYKTASDTLAELTTGFETEMDELQTALAEDIAAMDLSEEAEAAARATLQGYLNGATGMMPEIRTAFEEFGVGIVGALGGTVAAPVLPGGAVAIDGGYAAGTTNATPGWHMVGENGPELAYFSGGETVLNARDTAAVLGGTGPVNVNLNINVAGSATPETVAMLQNYGDEFTERVRIAIMEINEDLARRRY